jgi:hypothetical protein
MTGEELKAAWQEYDRQRAANADGIAPFGDGAGPLADFLIRRQGIDVTKASAAVWAEVAQKITEEQRLASESGRLNE